MNEVLKDTEQHMTVAVDAFKDELSRLRTGRASLSLLDGITIDYYGTQTPLNQVAALSVPETGCRQARLGATGTRPRQRSMRCWFATGTASIFSPASSTRRARRCWIRQAGCPTLRSPAWAADRTRSGYSAASSPMRAWR